MPIDLTETIAIVSLVVAAIAIVISYLTSRQSNQLSAMLAGSGFKAGESLKTDTIALASTLRSIVYKAAMYSQQDRSHRDDPKSPGYIDLETERSSIQTFLGSSTALAFYMFIDEKSAQAGGKGEAWRVFFLRLIQLLTAADTWSAGLTALDLERQLLSLTEQEILAMAKNLENVPDVLSKLRLLDQHDTIIQAVVSLTRDSVGPSPQEFSGFVDFLRTEGTLDPNVEMWWAIIHNDPTMLKTSLDGGADVNQTDKQLIAKYQAQWKDFKKRGVG